MDIGHGMVNKGLATLKITFFRGVDETGVVRETTNIKAHNQIPII